MGCSSCSSGMCGVASSTPRGCQNNGTCGTGGCNMMNSFDWLSDMVLPNAMKFDMVEVRFKGGRKDFFRNSQMLELYTGDMVVVEMPTGFHVGTVSLQGELVRLQMQRKKVPLQGEHKLILRKPTEKDMALREQSFNREVSTLYRTREIINSLNLNMKLSDVEFQADDTKATFFYSAEGRVDFRELIKILAAEFRIRVEMRQISLRQEAGRIGGIGACGRELCCSTWLTDFKNVTTAAARYQNLSLNPAKLSGQCGRLKCCLNYELETYLDALVDIPKVEQPLITVKGKATLQKVDIFKKILWFAYNQESTWHPLTAQRVTSILESNASGIPVLALNDETDVVARTAAHSEINFQTKPRDRNQVRSKSNDNNRPHSPYRNPQNRPENKSQKTEKTKVEPENPPSEDRPESRKKQQGENKQGNRHRNRRTKPGKKPE